MKEIIEKLRAEANLNISNGEDLDEAGHDYHDNTFTGVAISNREALQIADALEVAMYPPIVRAVLALLNCSELDGYHWAGVSEMGFLEVFEKEPYYRNITGDWWRESTWENYDNLAQIPTRLMQKVPAASLLFHRTPNGWEWYGNPNKQKEQQ